MAVKKFKMDKHPYFVWARDNHNIVIKSLNLFAVIMYFTHFVACLWFYSSRVRNFPKKCWVRSAGLVDSDWKTHYMVSFYWAFQTLSTVGYGDITAEDSFEILLSMLVIIVGTGFYSYAIGNLTSIITSFDEENFVYESKILSLKQFQFQNNISDKLYYRIHNFIDSSQSN